MQLLVKPNFPVLSHPPIIAVLTQMRHQLAVGMYVQELFTHSAVAPVVISFILFLAGGAAPPPDRRSLSRPAHFR